MDGYTTQFIERQIRAFLDIEYSNIEQRDQFGPEEFNVFSDYRL